MIKFFRKIRQQLLSESKFSKYLFYAIGEIVLVVVGILIAVNINSWNKKQDLEANNKIYYSKLLEELKLNIKRLNYLAYEYDGGNDLANWDVTVENSDSLLTLVTIGLQEKDLGFLLHKKIWSGGSQLNLHNATYEELLGTGKLYSLGSDSLILGLKDYYKRYEREVDYNRRWTEFALEGMNQIEYSRGKMKIDYSRNPDKFDLNDYPWFFNTKSKEYIDLQLGVKKLLVGQSHHLRKCKEMIKSTSHLIELIEREIQKQNSQ